MTQYDALAPVYHAIADAAPLREPEWYSFSCRLGNLTGLAVLDRVCGEGACSHHLKQWGAARVVGVDISAPMIALARRQEAAQPLGIEYQVADAARLGTIGAFDRVTASYFLHYAQSREHLRQMVQTVYDNLKPGQRFVASNANPHHPPPPVLDHRQYGVVSRLVDAPFCEGSRIRVTLVRGEQTAEFESYWWPWAIYEEVFRTVGFRSWQIEPYLIPPDAARTYGEGFWDVYLAAQPAIQIICEK